MKKIFPATFVAVVLLVLHGCGSNSSSPTGPAAGTSAFLGTFASIQGQNGTLAVAVQAKVARATMPFSLPLVATLHAQSISATGSLSQVGGGTTSLSGTYDAGSKNLSLSGGGFTMSGTLGGATVTGTLTAPTGAVGAFATTNSCSGAVEVYCVQQTTPSGEKVVFNVAVSPGGAISGTFAATPSGAGTVTGQRTGTNFTSTYVTTVGPFAGDSGTSTGTMANGLLNGVDRFGNPFSGSTAACGNIANIAGTIGGNPGTC